jgi:hypothetical protein
MKPTALQRWILVLLATLLGPAAHAQEARPPVIAGVKVGIGGRYKVGVWTPIEVVIRGGSSPVTGRVRTTVADSDGLNCSFEAAGPCTIPPGQDKSVGLYVRFGREASTIGLELLVDNVALAAKAIDSSRDAAQDQFADALRPEQRLVVAVAKDPADFEKALPGSQGQSPQNVVAAVDSLARLPDRWEGYEGIDFVIISTSDASLFAKTSPYKAQIEALDQWVRLGGALVLCAGSNAAATLEAGAPLARFVPGRFDKTVMLGQATSAWETYARSNTRIPAPKAGGNAELAIARLTGVQGKVEAHEADLPLVIRSPRGLGQIVFVAADLDRGPLREWSDRPLLLAALLGLPVNVQANDATDTSASYGYSDLAGQLRSALDQPRGVRLVPFFVVTLLAIVYILLIGPGDYFLLRRLGRGMHWTWITFPATVVIFSVGAYAAACWFKGEQLRVNQIDLVDFDGEGAARGASWFSIFSPRGDSFDLSMLPHLPGGQAPREATVSLGWLGKAGGEFNGMYRRDAPGASPAWNKGYSIAPSLDAIQEVPIPVWGSKSFVQRWLGQAPNPGLKASLKDDQGRLSGAIVNQLGGNNANGIQLSHCFLVYESWAYMLGTLQPGGEVEIGPGTRRISLNTFMGGESLDSTPNSAEIGERTPYDRGSRDMVYVLQRMLFYDAAGGRKQTGLANGYQSFTDLSGLLKTGRAILVGMPPEDGVCRGGDLLGGPVGKRDEAESRRSFGDSLDRHATIYRFVLPVAAAQAGPAN